MSENTLIRENQLLHHIHESQQPRLLRNQQLRLLISRHLDLQVSQLMLEEDRAALMRACASTVVMCR